MILVEDIFMTKEIVLIIVGIVIVIVSFIISEKEEKKKLGSDDLKDELKTEILEAIKSEQKNIQNDKENFLEDKQIDILDKIEDEMSRLSNEKIMSFSEYGEQILGKIEQNHQEVVFLYDMLNQKESEMKEFIKKIDSSKIKLEEMLIAVKEEEKDWSMWTKEKDETMQELARKEIALQKVVVEEKKLTEVKENVKPETKKSRQKKRKRGKASGNLSGKRKEEIDGIRQFEEIKLEDGMEKVENQTNNADKEGKDIAADTGGGIIFEENEGDNSFSSETEEEKANSNESVLDLHMQGMSIMEIAKVLGRGQGEVKLIIDLYQGEKK